MITKNARKLCLPLVVFSLMFTPTDADASIFGEENVVLGNILATNLQSLNSINNSIEVMSDSLDTAREAASYANDAVKVVENISMIISDPVGYTKANAKLFASSFPEIEALKYDTQRLKQNLQNIDFDGEYDPYMTRLVLEEVQEMDNPFHAMVELLDEWDVSDPHNQIMQHARENQDRAVSVQAQINTELQNGDLTPQEAAVYNAQAAAITAEATTQTTLILNDLVKLEKARFANEFETSLRSRDAWLKQVDALSDVPPAEAFAMPVAPQ
ncbi:MAG: hypothetical protein AAFQ77_03125 [Myxococcota bacterium]